MAVMRTIFPEIYPRSSMRDAADTQTFTGFVPLRGKWFADSFLGASIEGIGHLQTP
jgi:hypothetical protein